MGPPERCINQQGYQLRPILLYSLFITGIGIVLLRLATANTQGLAYIKTLTLAILGALLATAPWIILLFVSTVILILFNAGLHDLTWLLKMPSQEEIPAAMAGGRLKFLTRVEGTNGPRLQRNATI